VSFSTKHTNFIINSGGGTADNVRELIDYGRSIVLERFGVTLEREIEFIGDGAESE
jgi:UDP-N-acetylmuramate dehydrogenase